jgi:hypothetical protein
MVDTNKYSKDTTSYSDNYMNSRGLLNMASSIGADNQDYTNALTSYSGQVKDIQTSRNAYLKRISDGTYLNKIVKFTNGTYAFVTNQGYVKKLEADKDTYTNIPNRDIVSIALSWNPNWIPGQLISTDPQLVVGTPMTTTSQSIGNEGNNVQFNSFDVPTDIEYAGCYTDSSSPTYIGSRPSINYVSNGDFSQNNINWPALSNTVTLSESQNLTNWVSNATYYKDIAAAGYSARGPTGKIKLVELVGPKYISQTIDSLPPLSSYGNANYELSFYYCGTINGSNNNSFEVKFNGIKQAAIQPNSKNWTLYKKNVTVTTTGPKVLQFQGTGISGKVAIQDVTMYAVGDYTYEHCRNTAVYQGKQFFGLQQYNAETETGFCSVSNTVPSTNTAITEQEKPLWQSENQTNKIGVSAQLSINGVLTLYDNNNNDVYSSDSSTNADYMGCFQKGTSGLTTDGILKYEGMKNMREGFTPRYREGLTAGQKHQGSSTSVNSKPATTTTTTTITTPAPTISPEEQAVMNAKTAADTTYASELKILTDAKNAADAVVVATKKAADAGDIAKKQATYDTAVNNVKIITSYPKTTQALKTSAINARDIALAELNTAKELVNKYNAALLAQTAASQALIDLNNAKAAADAKYPTDLAGAKTAAKTAADKAAADKAAADKATADKAAADKAAADKATADKAAADKAAADKAAADKAAADKAAADKAVADKAAADKAAADKAAAIAEEQKRLAAIAEQNRLAAIAEQERIDAISDQQKRIDEQKKLDAIAEQNRLDAIAEQNRLAAIAEQNRLAAIAEQNRLAAISDEQNRLAAIAEQNRLNAIAEQNRLAAIAEQERIAAEEQQKMDEKEAADAKAAREKAKSVNEQIANLPTDTNDTNVTIYPLDPKNKKQICNAYARENGYDYYYLDNSNQCYAFNTFDPDKNRVATTCSVDDSSPSGGPDSYAIYMQTESKYSESNRHFYLEVDDNIVTIFRGRPESSQGPATILYTVPDDMTLFPNPEWKSENGKDGTNILLPHKILAENEWVGSPNGTLRLQVKNGHLMVVTNREKCSRYTNSAKKSYSYGDIGANAVYNLGEGVANNGSKFNALSYIDADSKLYSYESGLSLLDSTYKDLPNVNIPRKDGTTQSSISSRDQCKAKCDPDDRCVGYSYNSSLQACNILQETDFPGAMMTSDANYYSSLKDKKPKTTRTNVGISNTVVGVGSNQYTNYSVGTSYKPDRVGWDLSDDNSPMNKEADKMIGNQYDAKASQVQVQYDKNNTDYRDTSAEQKRSDLIEKGVRIGNYGKIVDDSDIVVLQQNSSYLLWSILAVGTVLVSINIVR